MPRQHAPMTACVLLACVLLALDGHAEPRTLRIAVVATAPYGFLQGSHPAGLSAELGLALAAGADCESTTLLLSRADALRALAAGRADMAVMPGGPGSDEAVVSLGPLLHSRFAAIARAGTPLRSRDDLRGKTVAVALGEPRDPLLSKRRGVALLPVSSATRGLKLLVAGQVDAAAGEWLSLLHAVDAMHLPAKTFGSPLPLSPVSVDLLIPATLDQETADRLTRTMERLEARESFRIIAARYGL